MFEKTQQWVRLALEAEAHAFALLAIGGLLALKGVHDMGSLVVGAGLAIFKGNKGDKTP